MKKCTCWKRDLTGGAVSSSQFSAFVRAVNNTEKKGLSDVGDYKVDRGLSNKWVNVFHNPQNNHTVVVHRGSSTLDDAWTDVKLFFGQTNNDRFKTSQRIQRAAEKKYGTSNMSVLGSSLGGYLAHTYGKNASEIITSGRPVTPGDVLKGRKQHDNEYNVRTTHDPVAVLQNFNKNTGRDLVIPSRNKLNILDSHLAENVMAHLPADKQLGNPAVGAPVAEAAANAPEGEQTGGKVTQKSLQSI